MLACVTKMRKLAYLAVPTPTSGPVATLVFNLTSNWRPPNYRNACAHIGKEEHHILYQLHIIHIVFASLSVVGATSIIVYSVWRRSVRTSEVRPLFHLSLADVLLAVCWIIGAALWDRPMYYPMSFKACTVLQGVTEMFNVTTFYLTTNYALNVYVRLKDRLHRVRGQPLLQSSRWMLVSLKIVTVLSWLVPVSIMVPAIVRYKDIDIEQPCLQCLILFFTPSSGGFPKKHNKWLWNNYGAFYFVISLVFSIFSILVLYVLSIRIVFRKLLKTNVWTDKQRHQVRDVTIRISCYILVFIFCWTPALALALIDIKRDGDASVEKYSWLYILQGMTAPSQGFLNCIVYGWTKKSFRMAQHPDAGTPLVKQTYRVYGTAKGQAKFPAKPSRTHTPPPIASSASESNLTGYERQANRWSRSSSHSDFSN